MMCDFYLPRAREEEEPPRPMRGGSLPVIVAVATFETRKSHAASLDLGLLLVSPVSAADREVAFRSIAALLRHLRAFHNARKVRTDSFPEAVDDLLRLGARPSQLCLFLPPLSFSFLEDERSQAPFLLIDHTLLSNRALSLRLRAPKNAAARRSTRATHAPLAPLGRATPAGCLARSLSLSLSRHRARTNFVDPQVVGHLFVLSRLLRAGRAAAAARREAAPSRATATLTALIVSLAQTEFLQIADGTDVLCNAFGRSLSWL